MEFITAFLLGFTYSPHCAGMCGPLALAFPTIQSGYAKKLWLVFLYNLGRITTYFCLGLIFGLFGRGIHLAGFQQITTIFLGITIILAALTPWFVKPSSFMLLFLKKFTDKFSWYFAKTLGSQNKLTYLIIGLLNGLLPCGLVYLAVAASLLMNNVIDSGLYMAFFGLGTVPIMSAIILFKTRIQSLLQRKIRKIIPWLTIIIGILFILRGLNLGIKYISPASEVLKPASKIESGPPPCCD